MYYRTSISRIFRVYERVRGGEFSWMGRVCIIYDAICYVNYITHSKMEKLFFKKKGPNTIDYKECIFLRYI